MHEPKTIGYNRQIGQSVYIFWLIEPGDLGALAFPFCINGVLFESNVLYLWILFFFFVHIIAFRPGRPRGYDRHFFATLAAVRYLRPGRSERKAFIRETALTQK